MIIKTFYPKALQFLSIALIIGLTSFDMKESKAPELKEKAKSDEEVVRQTLLSLYDFINKEDLTDSLTYNKFKTFYDEKFVLLPSNAEPLSDKETILEGWRGLFKTHKGNFDVTIDRIEVSGDMAYALYSYREVFTNLKTKEKQVDVMHSAISILKRDAKNNWKVVVTRWT